MTLKLVPLTPREALNKSYLKLKPGRSEVDLFKANLQDLLGQAQSTESEEYHKNLIANFLRNTYYGKKNFINTKKKTDLVIHNGPEPSASVGVLIEAKRPSNKSEMISVKSLDSKAFQELVLYYLRERFSTTPNLEIRRLVITNAFEWYIFDASIFESHFAKDKALVAKFTEFEQGRLPSVLTDFFYKDIASPAIKALAGEIEFCYFDLRRVSNDLSPDSRKNDSEIASLYKVLSPQHFLKLPFVNDSNTLHKGFYGELLHIIGLSETRDGSKRLIGRKPIGQRDAASLIENTILQLDTLDKLQRINNPGRFGATNEQKIFAVALELVLTWVNRILFLKLIEGQLSSYSTKVEYQKFLNVESVAGFDTLNGIFFQVLARPSAERDAGVRDRFSHVPYLNSSLFEPTELEHETIFISSLEDDKKLPIFSSTALKDERGRKSRGSLSALQYLFSFLDAYDFASDSSEEAVEEDSKTLINASVLGLIFEKINGYKDGSFFTPGFVTMHIARDLVRGSVIARFNDAYGWSCKSIDDLFNRIEISERRNANSIINSIRICDPAVGSGHFLVSVLNELLEVKADLHILMDREGRRLKEYQISVENDELIILDENGEFFSYNPSLKESQRVQEAIFHEKQVLIESCLFGVDINPNSVNICRLRLWIELLKHAYFRKDGQLETLPNIDINIKTGNSLVSRFSVVSDLRKILKKKKLRITDYRAAIGKYQNATSKSEKRDVKRFIEALKSDLRSEIFDNDPKVRRLRLAEEELRASESQQALFQESVAKRRVKKARETELAREVTQLSEYIENIRNNRVFENAFEWRFEFPEVLDDEGEFVGFDVVVGNPPYGVSVKDLERTYLCESLGKVPDFEIYYWFTLLAKSILRPGGILGYIVPNTFLFNVNASDFRISLLESWVIREILDCTDVPVFVDAVVRNSIITLENSPRSQFVGFRNTANVQSFEELTDRPLQQIETEILEADNYNWGILFKSPASILDITRKLRGYPKLQDEFDSSQGYIPYRQSDLIKLHGTVQAKNIVENRLWHSSERLDENYIQEIHGRSLTRYSFAGTGVFVKYGKHVASYVALKYFRGKRLLVREITNPQIIASIVDEEFINDPQIISIISKPGSTLSIEFLWAILNSEVATFFHFNASPKATKGLFPKILVQDIRGFPLPPNLSDEKCRKVEDLVVAILGAHSGRDIYEQELNNQIFSLYQLGAEEMVVIREDLRRRREKRSATLADA